MRDYAISDPSANAHSDTRAHANDASTNASTISCPHIFANSCAVTSPLPAPHAFPYEFALARTNYDSYSCAKPRTNATASMGTHCGDPWRACATAFDYTGR